MAEIARARDVIGTILGEAGGKTLSARYDDMLHVASTIVNRAAATGESLQSIISAKDQYDAYGKALPPGTNNPRMRAIAEMALNQIVTKGPVTTAMFMNTAAAAPNQVKGLTQVAQTQAHIYSVDQTNRAIRTSAGYVTPDPEAMAMGYAPTPTDTKASAALSSLGGAKVSYNHPDRGAWYSGLSPDMAHAVETLGANLPDGVSLTSAYRSPSVNKSVKGAKNSQHMTGNAVDVDLSGMTNTERAKAVETARMTGATRIGAYSASPNMMHVDFAAGYAPNNNVDTYAMFDETASKMRNAPGWFTQGLTQTTVPTPTPRPAFDTAIAQAAPAAMEAQSVQSMSVPGTPDIGVDTNVGFFAGKPGKVAGVPAQSVKTASFTPDMAMADAAPATPTADEAFSGTTQSPSSRALADLAAKADDQSISEIAGTQVGAVAPTNAYSTTNLPSVAPSINPALQAAVAPAPVAQITPQAVVRPPAVPTPKVTAPTIAAPQTRAPTQSMPSGVQAAMDFHAGINNAAMASNGNTLSRDALGNSYNYSPSFDVTTISDPTGRTVGVKQGKVSPDMAGPSATAASTSAPGTSKGLFSGIGDTIKDTFSNDNVSNAVVGGLGGLGGAAVGSLLGPVGSMVGSAIGRSLAVQHNPFAPQPGTFTVNTFQGPMTFASPIGGLGGLGGFPSAPRGAPGALGGSQSNRSTGEMRGMSPRAADAIGKGMGGLY